MLLLVAMVVQDRDVRIAKLQRRSGRLGAAVMARDGQIEVLNGEIGGLEGDVIVRDAQFGVLIGVIGELREDVTARITALHDRAEKLWKGLSDSRTSGASGSRRTGSCVERLLYTALASAFWRRRRMHGEVGCFGSGALWWE